VLANNVAIIKTEQKEHIKESIMLFLKVYECPIIEGSETTQMVVFIVPGVWEKGPKGEIQISPGCMSAGEVKEFTARIKKDVERIDKQAEQIFDRRRAKQREASKGES